MLYEEESSAKTDKPKEVTQLALYPGLGKLPDGLHFVLHRAYALAVDLVSQILQL